MSIMKKIQKWGLLFTAVLFVAVSVLVPSKTAYAAATATFSVSGGGNVTQGNTIKITVSVSGSDIMSYAKVSVNYDASVLEYQSGADSGGSGRVSILFDCGEGAKSASRTLTFKAKAVGSASVSLDTAEATTMGSASVLPEMMTASVGGAAGVTVTAPAQASDDAHIGWMDISPGTLSPSFSKDVYKYSVEVENNVKKVTVSALASHEKAVIASVKGGTNLKVGQNTITVTCKAENGSTAVYTIIVTRKEGETQDTPTEEPSDVTETPDVVADEAAVVSINGTDWYISGDFKEKEIPEGFEETVTLYQQKEIKAAKFSKGELYLLYLTDAEKKNGTFFVYYPENGTIEEMVKLSFMEGTYLIILSPEQYGGVPEGLTEKQFALEDRNLRGWQPKLRETENSSDAQELTLGGISADGSMFYLVYGMNQEGNAGWYVIDTQEGTIQRFVLFAENEAAEPEEETAGAAAEPTAEITQMEKKIEIFQFCILGMSALMIILIIVLVIIVIKGRKKVQEDEEGKEAEEEWIISEEEVSEKTENQDEALEELEFIDLDDM